MSDYLNAINSDFTEEELTRQYAIEAGLGNFPFHANEWETLTEWIERMADKYGLPADLVLTTVVATYPDNFLRWK